MSKKLSCGFIIQDKKTNKFLGCHPTGRFDGYCDIPKGCQEDGETHLETALRELKEETGISEEELSDIKELGFVKYRPDKDLWLFHAYADIDIKKLVCTSLFEFHGTMMPEMCSYELGKNISIFSHNLQNSFKKIMNDEPRE